MRLEVQGVGCMRCGNLSLIPLLAPPPPQTIQKTTSSYTFDGLHLVFKLAVLGE